MTHLIALLVFAQSPVFPAPPTAADWAAARCVRQSDSSVSCSALAFKALTDTTIDAQADVEKLTLKVATQDAQLQALQAALLAVPPPKPPPTNTKPLVAVATAVLGTMAVTAGATTSTLSPEARAGLGIAGVAAIAGSFIIIF